MRNQTRSQKMLPTLVGLLAMAATTLTPNGSVASAAAAGTAHKVHVAVKSISVIQDGDTTAGCGEVAANFVAHIVGNEDGQKEQRIDNGNPYVNSTREYCSGTLYFTEISDLANRIVLAQDLDDHGDQTVHILADFVEWDNNPLKYVDAYQTKDIAVPKPGHFSDFSIRVQGTNSSGAVDILLGMRIRTF